MLRCRISQLHILLCLLCSCVKDAELVKCTEFQPYTTPKCDRLRTRVMLKTIQQVKIQILHVVNQLTGHSEPTDEQPDVPSPDHDTLAPINAIADSSVLILPRGPDPDEQNQDIEDDNSHKTLGVDAHLLFLRVPAPRSGAIAHGELESHGENFEDIK